MTTERTLGKRKKYVFSKFSIFQGFSYFSAIVCFSPAFRYLSSLLYTPDSAALRQTFSPRSVPLILSYNFPLALSISNPCHTTPPLSRPVVRNIKLLLLLLLLLRLLPLLPLPLPLLLLLDSLALYLSMTSSTRRSP